MTPEFNVHNAAGYEQLMGRWSRRLARPFIDFTGGLRANRRSNPQQRTLPSMPRQRRWLSGRHPRSQLCYCDLSRASPQLGVSRLLLYPWPSNSTVDGRN